MKKLNENQTVANPVFSTVTENKNVSLSLNQFYDENPTTLKVGMQITALMLTLPIITFLLLVILKMN